MLVFSERLADPLAFHLQHTVFPMWYCCLPSHPGTRLFNGGNTRRLPRKTSRQILQPEPIGDIPRGREAHRASGRLRRAERYVVHDSGRCRVDGVQHVWSGCRAVNEGDIALFNGLRGTQYAIPV